MLNEKEIAARLNPLKPEIAIVQKRLKNLFLQRRAKTSLIPYREIFELFRGQKKILSFIEQYHGTAFNMEAFDNFTKVKLADMSIDMRYQRITDLEKCFENVIKVGGFDGTLAEPLMVFRSHGKFNWRVSDGGHRTIMLFLTGMTEYSVIPTEHEEGLSTEQEVEIEAQRFVIKNTITNVVDFLNIFKAWLNFPNDTQEYQDAQMTLAILLEANLDVKHGYFIPSAPRIDKLKGIHEDLHKPFSQHHKSYTQEAFISASEIMQEAYPDADEIIIEDLLCLARLISKAEDHGIFQKEPVVVDTLRIRSAYIQYAKSHNMGDLTREMLQKNKLPTLDYNAMKTLFKLTKKQDQELRETWQPTIVE